VTKPISPPDRQTGNRKDGDEGEQPVVESVRLEAFVVLRETVPHPEDGRELQGEFQQIFIGY
jgi:hypothetical protein